MIIGSGRIRFRKEFILLEFDDIQGILPESIFAIMDCEWGLLAIFLNRWGPPHLLNWLRNVGQVIEFRRNRPGQCLPAQVQECKAGEVGGIRRNKDRQAILLQVQSNYPANAVSLDSTPTTNR